MQTQILPKSPIFKNVKYVYEPHLLWAVTNFAQFSHNFLDLKNAWNSATHQTTYFFATISHLVTSCVSAQLELFVFPRQGRGGDNHDL